MKKLEIFKKNSEFRNISFFDTFILLIVLISIISIIFLCLTIFHSIPVLVISLIILIFLLFIFNYKIIFAFKKSDWILFIILLCAIFFRSGPYLWLMGGQDQGLYVNMSAYYENHGSTFIKDEIKSKLNPESRAYYDEQNMVYKIISNTAKELTGNYPRIFDGRRYWFARNLPGIYVKNLNNSENVFQFYPLHPLWLAIFGKLFGFENNVYATSFFSLLTVIILYLLALEISGGKKAPAYIIAILLAVNPLHSFFSKFPVSEIPALFFSSAGFYYLIKYYRQSRDECPNPLYLFLSGGLFTGLFFTRISGFMLMPFFCGLLFLLVWSGHFVKNKSINKKLIFFCILIIIIFGLSLLYGFIYSFPYSIEVYSSILPTIVLNYWKLFLSVVLLGLISLQMVFFLSSKFYMNIKDHKFIKIMNDNLNQILPLLLILVVCLAFFCAMLTGFKEGYNLFFGSNIVVTISYLTIFGFIVFLLAINYYRRKNDVIIQGLIFNLLIFWIAKTVIMKYTPYQYYYARYLLSEVVPFSLLLVALYMGDLFEQAKWKKYLAVIGMVLISCLSLYYTSFQLRGREAEGAFTALNEVKKQTSKSDLVYMVFKDAQIITPLKYYFDLNVVYVPGVGQMDKSMLASFIETYNDLYVLSDKPIFENYLSYIKTIDYRYGEFEHTTVKIPTRFESRGKNLYFYRIDRDSYFSLSKTVKPGQVSTENFYDDNIWTNGNGILTRLTYTIEPTDTYLILKTYGYNPYGADLNKLKLRISVNGKDLTFSHRDNNAYYFALSKSYKKIHEIRIASSTFIPRELNINTDERVLGVDVQSIQIAGKQIIQ